ncbi:MAG TPA: methionine--tRNA ligase [Methanocorpusculum sp.]|nr:methionine--tRNA ligase [Methanocorpusculum sp.]
MNNTPTIVTCGLPYTNGLCHLGHLRTYIPGDFYVRYLRRLGDDIVFICGSDNHGTPIVVTAESEHTDPRTVCEQYHAHFKEVFDLMNIRFDWFGMTDDLTNHNRTQSIIKKLIQNGYIYSKTIQQSYCPNCNRFLPDRYVEGVCPYCGQHARGDECDMGCGRHLEPGDIVDPTCATCKSKAELREQTHYYFKLSGFRDYLLQFLPTLGGSSNARNYAIKWVESELKDWCVTRMLDWGVKFPDDNAKDLVTYVWVDAPIGYISFTEEWAKKTGNNWQKYWCESSNRIHFIGSDITYHHCIFWPALLHGAGYQPPTAVVASGMVTINGQKFSKSRGNVVWTKEDYIDSGLPVDYLRYYFLSYTSHTRELDFSWNEFQARINNELVNTFGNFANRCMTLIQKFGSIPDTPIDREIFDKISQTMESVEKSVREFEFKSAIDGILLLAGYGNSYISNTAPWKLMKEDKESAARVLKNCLQIIKACTLLIQPAIPVSAQNMWNMLGYTDQVETHNIQDALIPFENHELGIVKPLFSKIEDTKIQELEETFKKRITESQTKEPDTMNTEIEPFLDNIVTIDDLSKLDLRVGQIINAERVPKTDKLMKLQVDIGIETRQIISGIAQYYTPDELVGKKVIVIVNLKPAKLHGEMSNGMIFAAGDTASLLVPLNDVIPGTQVH